MTAKTPFRTGYVALLGRPNAGKSTLLNVLLGQKLSIITAKPQTTRHRILGIKTLPRAQLLFLDTPGVHKATKAINTAMLRAVRSAIADADVCVVLVIAGDPAGDAEELLVDALGKSSASVIIAPNKIDRVRKEKLLPQIDEWRRRLPAAAIVPISALKSDGTDHLLQEIVARLPEGPALYPADQLTDLNERFFVSEIIREKIFALTGQEVPYATAVTVDEFKEDSKRGLARISATIHVEKNSQKAILIGKGGLKLKEIGTRARRDIETLLGKRVHLSLWVRVDPNWTRDEKEVRRLGYPT